MSKQFNNAHGTTSSEFNLGVGFGTNLRSYVLFAESNGVNPIVAGDRFEDTIELTGVEFFDLKMLATDSAGNIATKQIRGRVSPGGTVYKVEDIFQETAEADVELVIAGNVLNITCAKGLVPLTYNIYISLLRAG